jgi:predicted metal-dependent phosphoesterase TrpH
VLVDFHCHTLESDGTLAPLELAAAMRKRGVEIFSVTDHDTVGAYEKLAHAAGNAEIVVGVELNTTYRGNEVHVLGYGFPIDSASIAEAIAKNRVQRHIRAERMVAQLESAGYDLSFEDVRAEAGSDESALGRPHVARALIRKGYARDLDTAFRELLTPGKAGYVPQTYLRPHDAVALVARAGGVAVLAHPGRLKDESVVEELVDAGLAGIETFYPTHDANMTAHYRELAARYGLVMTAGSDFHDARYNARGVGMEVARDDITPFLDLVT